MSQIRTELIFQIIINEHFKQMLKETLKFQRVDNKGHKLIINNLLIMNQKEFRLGIIQIKLIKYQMDFKENLLSNLNPCLNHLRNEGQMICNFCNSNL